MSNYLVLRRTLRKSHHIPRGKTRHYLGSDEIQLSHELIIVQIPPDEGYYLLYLDGEGNELTDTYHDSLEKALDQAKWEFNIEADEWENLTSHAKEESAGHQR